MEIGIGWDELRIRINQTCFSNCTAQVEKEEDWGGQGEEEEVEKSKEKEEEVEESKVEKEEDWGEQGDGGGGVEQGGGGGVGAGRALEMRGHLSAGYPWQMEQSRYHRPPTNKVTPQLWQDIAPQYIPTNTINSNLSTELLLKDDFATVFIRCMSIFFAHDSMSQIISKTPISPLIGS